MFYNRLGGGAGSAKELLNASGSKIADLESRGSGKVSVVGGLGNTPPEKVLQGSIYSDESGVRRTGTMEDITPDLNTQSDLIKEIRAMLVGRVTEANAKPEDILKGKKAYVGEKLVIGVLEKGAAKGTLKLSANQNSVTIDHGLGVTPKGFYMIGGDGGWLAANAWGAFYPCKQATYPIGMGYMYNNKITQNHGGTGDGVNDKQIKLIVPQNLTFSSSVTYNWIAFA